MTRSIDWSAVRTLFIEERPEVRTELFLQDGFVEHPFSVTTRLAPELAQRFKAEIGLFYVLAVELALQDHLLTDAEDEELRHFARISRLAGTDVVDYQAVRVRQLLCREMAILLHDFRMEPEEMLRKARLQSVFNLGYDHFCRLISMEFEKVTAALLHAIGVMSIRELTPEGRAWIQKQINALDGIFKISNRNPVRSIHNFPE